MEDTPFYKVDDPLDLGTGIQQRFMKSKETPLCIFDTFAICVSHFSQINIIFFRTSVRCLLAVYINASVDPEIFDITWIKNPEKSTSCFEFVIINNLYHSFKKSTTIIT